MAKDLYEVDLRRTLCILVALETLLVCGLSVWLSSAGNDMILLEYHEVQLGNVIGLPTFLSVLFIIGAALSWLSRAAYLIWEMLHILTGVVTALPLMLSGGMGFCMGILIVGLLSVRYVIYRQLMKRHRRREEERMQEEEESMILYRNDTV